MWTKEGYHKDVAILDSDQVIITESKVGDPTNSMIVGGYIGPSVVIKQSDFPEAVCFEIIVSEYKR